MGLTRGRRGKGGGGGAGVAKGAAAKLFEHGSDELGIAITLLVEGAGPKWGLVGAQRQVADVGASINWRISTGALRITLPPSLVQPSQAGAWSIVYQNGAATGVNIDQANNRIVISIPPGGATLSDIATFMRAATYTGRAGTSDFGNSVQFGTGGTVVVTSGNTRVNQPGGAVTVQGFAGGIDAVPLSATLDTDALTYTIHYDAGEDDLNEIVAMINGGDDASAELFHGTDGTDAPEAVGFTRPFQPVGGKGEDGEDGTADVAAHNVAANAHQAELDSIRTDLANKAEQSALQDAIDARTTRDNAITAAVTQEIQDRTQAVAAVAGDLAEHEADTDVHGGGGTGTVNQPRTVLHNAALNLSGSYVAAGAANWGLDTYDRYFVAAKWGTIVEIDKAALQALTAAAVGDNPVAATRVEVSGRSLGQLSGSNELELGITSTGGILVAADDNSAFDGVIKIWGMRTAPAGSSIAKATNAIVDAVTATGTTLAGIASAARAALDDVAYMTARKTARMLDRVVKPASTTIRGVVLLARTQDLDARETDTSRVPTVAGTEVVVNRLVKMNPAEAATQTAEKIEVNGVIYSLPTGSPPAQTEHIRAGISVDSSVGAADLTVSSATDTLILPTATGYYHVGLWRADADGGDPTEVHIQGGGNARNTYGAASDLTVGGVDGKLIVSVDAQNMAASHLGGASVRIV